MAEGPAAQKTPSDNPEHWFAPEHATAKLLVLGTFHFKDAGLDGYKPEVDVDFLSEPRQTELKEVLDRLERFAPTKILIEAKAERAEELNERYRQYVAGKLDLEANEIYQVGFRLAKRLGQERLYAVDVMGRNYVDLPDLEAYAVEQGQSFPRAELWEGRLTELYQHDDQLKAKQTLREHLLYLNSEDRLRIGHGHYVLSYLGLGTDEEYPATDSLTGWWYNRNLRIFSKHARDGTRRSAVTADRRRSRADHVRP